MSDFNTNVIEEFRANHGRVGGPFEGAPMVLVHHRGRKSGTEYVTPMMYLPDKSEPDTIYVFASKAGAPSNPEWYRNLVATGRARVEVGDEHEHQVRGLGIERGVADLVDDQERDVLEAVELLVEVALAWCVGEQRDPFGGGAERDAVAG